MGPRRRGPGTRQACPGSDGWVGSKWEGHGWGSAEHESWGQTAQEQAKKDRV